MTTAALRRPVLARHVRCRWDAVRERHQLVYPEGVLLLNATAAAIVTRCDGRSREELMADLKRQYQDANAADVDELLGRLARRGWVCDADA